MADATGLNSPVLYDDRFDIRASSVKGTALPAMRDEQLKLIYRAGLVLGVAVLILSAWRNIIFGWHPTFYLNVTVFAMVFTGMAIGQDRRAWLQAAGTRKGFDVSFMEARQ